MSNYKLSIGHSKSEPIVILYFNNKRHRFWNGKAIGLELKSSDDPTLLKAAFELKLREGWRPKEKKKRLHVKPLTVVQALEQGVMIKIAQGCSDRFVNDVKRVVELWKRYEVEYGVLNLTLDNLEASNIRDFLVRPNWSPKTQRTVKSTLSPLLKEFKPNLVKTVTLKKPISALHKPFADITQVLDEIKAYNEKLYMCCLMTYGCLLRPHREIRELTWGDFSEDLSHINLSGNRNKSGRNRIVPVPSYIKNLLIPSHPQDNIFSNSPKPYNEDYFKTLWSRFKALSNCIEAGQTLYSFRHSGAIEIFKRTGSLTKLQKAMGHSSITVSITYLRGLEIAELTEEDMPKV